MSVITILKRQWQNSEFKASLDKITRSVFKQTKISDRNTQWIAFHSWKERNFDSFDVLYNIILVKKKTERRTSIEMHHLHSESKIVFKYPITVEKAATVAYGRANVRERTFYSMSILKTSILKVVLFSLLVLKSIIFLFLFKFSPYMKGILKCPFSLQDQTTWLPKTFTDFLKKNKKLLWEATQQTRQLTQWQLPWETEKHKREKRTCFWSISHI